ncbi:ARS binding protein 2-domain-containing protein [Lipomyces chichibuensis]|uniref:ARS binding protein 2-domain-containing protein n=1 Tax=Lipomyces chichibuensis TaxID=1546026 RepID=UPI003344054F
MTEKRKDLSPPPISNASSNIRDTQAIDNKQHHPASSRHVHIEDQSDYYYQPGLLYPDIVGQPSSSSTTTSSATQPTVLSGQRSQLQSSELHQHQQQYPVVFQDLYETDTPLPVGDSGSEPHQQQSEHYTQEHHYLPSSYAQQFFRQPDSLLFLSESHEFSLGSNPEVEQSGQQSPLPPQQPLHAAPPQYQDRTPSWPSYHHHDPSIGDSVGHSPESNSERDSGRSRSGSRTIVSPTQSQAPRVRQFEVYNPGHPSLSSSSTSSPQSRNVQPSRQTSASFSSANLSTASPVTFRGARMYRGTPPPTSASTVSGSQSIFHSNPEFDRTLSASVVPQLSQSLYMPQDRSLPRIPTLDERTPIASIEDAFVQFILYCNPTLPQNLDTTELRRAFRNVPKSDGKAFEVNRLLALLRQFETGEIRTWTRLVTELGVERTPEQSTQKIQQYAVRLKRWMRAMHIDTFFEFCMGHSHAYFTQIPDPSKPAAAVRDGVPTEEDLALRALLPELRQRRPRPSASTVEQEPQPSFGQETGPSRSSLSTDSEARQEQVWIHVSTLFRLLV